MITQEHCHGTRIPPEHPSIQLFRSEATTEMFRRTETNTEKHVFSGIAADDSKQRLFVKTGKGTNALFQAVAEELRGMLGRSGQRTTGMERSFFNHTHILSFTVPLLLFCPSVPFPADVEENHLRLIIITNSGVPAELLLHPDEGDTSTEEEEEAEGAGCLSELLAGGTVFLEWKTDASEETSQDSPLLQAYHKEL